MEKNVGGMMMLVLELVKQRHIIKEKYIEVKKKAARATYQAKCKAEKRRPGDVMQKDGPKGYVFKITKRIWSGFFGGTEYKK